MDMKIVTIAGIVSLTALEIAAMCTGNDGAFLLPVVAAIAGAAGFTVGLPINANKKR